MRILSITFRLFLLLISFQFSAFVYADSTDASQQTPAAPQINASRELTQMQVVLDKIKGQVSGSTNDSTLSQLNEMAQQLSENADTLGQSLIPERQKVDAQLAVLGAAPAPGSGVKETAEVSNKRRSLEARKTTLDNQIKQAEGLKSGGLNLSAQILNLRRDQVKTQLALNSGSIFSSAFWQPLYNSNQFDRDKITEFGGELLNAATLSWGPEWRVGTICWLLAAVLVMVLGRRYTEEFLAWVSINKLPEGRLRRSFLATAIALTTLLAIVLSFNFLAQAFTRIDEVDSDVEEYVSRLVHLSISCGLIAGLGRAFLSTRRPSWRLANITNEVALAMKPFPTIIASLVFIFQALETFNYSVGTSVNTTVFGNGLTALLIGIFCVVIILRINRTRRRMRNDEEAPPVRSTLAALIEFALFVTGLVILLALAIGYVSFGRYVSYETVWIGILFSSFYLLSQLAGDSCEAIFSTSNACGRRVQSSLNINERYLHQISSLLSALLKSALVLLLVFGLFNGTITSSSPADMLQKALAFWGGKGLEKLNIVPSQVVNAIIMLIASICVLRRVRRWLDEEFLPKTAMDKGMRVSVVTLFSNVGYVLVVLMTLSVMGVQWNKLAWIVSALSVGIGFGLQEIVKNFISGLILLTERPVKVGDLVGIGGYEGDIRRINVRATEIQLSDKSTVIVPNSQLISQNVRNATMGNAQGVVTIPLTFPLDIDPVQVKDILLGVYNDNERILDTPAPSVSFKDLSSQGILLSVTGNVATQRLISSVKSELLFEILVRLRNEGIALSSPQTMVIEQKASATPANPADILSSDHQG
ncbi:DUF3772 domain-containing protein [Tatumella citrea]|uniref:Mechanosensitive ion channel protein n=1 Tax=Tatumella citrea TaxID=53336 RepID=A0A1Y0LHD3_TATCI|nr:DUF3772 domain-containing protein [Tatumella citrea]ARU93462.1 mechanosensitive ion channel protein [Tatumella citrea]ARU97501.1 mechanosensitive ion channel protein [Tatumella citrea]